MPWRNEGGLISCAVNFVPVPSGVAYSEGQEVWMPRHLPLFAGIKDVDLHTGIRRFEQFDVARDQELVSRGNVALGLFVVKRGVLEVRIDGVVVGLAKAGDLVGEMALFRAGARGATVVAREDSEILTLSRANYEALRDVVHPVAQRIEAHTIAVQVRRLREVGDRIAVLARGQRLDKAPTRPSLFQAFRAQFGSAGFFSSEGVDPVSTMQRSPLFRGASMEALELIAELFEEYAYAEGTILCREGEVGTRMFLLDEGEVDVVVATGEGLQHAATLVPGAAFGMVSLASGGDRMSTCVAKSRVVVHELSGEHWALLIGHPYGAGGTFRRAMIHAFAEHLTYANQQLAEFEREDAVEKSNPGDASTG
jgi:CRP-like cAMP-binding protein